MPSLFLHLDLDDPFVAQTVTTELAATLRQAGFTVAPVPLPPDARQPMGGSLLEIGQQILANKEFYTAWLQAITAIVNYLKERRTSHTVAVTQADRTRTLTTDAGSNEALLRALLLDDTSVTIQIRD